MRSLSYSHKNRFLLNGIKYYILSFSRQISEIKSHLAYTIIPKKNYFLLQQSSFFSFLLWNPNFHFLFPKKIISYYDLKYFKIPQNTKNTVSKKKKNKRNCCLCQIIHQIEKSNLSWYKYWSQTTQRQIPETGHLPSNSSK